MRLWVTKIRAVDPISGDLLTWAGPNVPGISWADAADYCQKNGLGYCEVEGELIAEIPTLNDGATPNWAGRIDYENPGLN